MSSTGIRGVSVNSQGAGTPGSQKKEPSNGSGASFVIKGGKLVKKTSQASPAAETPTKEKKKSAFSIVGGKLVKNDSMESPTKSVKKKDSTDDKKKKKTTSKKK
jgi:retron-type reverse transcriptase